MSLRKSIAPACAALGLAVCCTKGAGTDPAGPALRNDTGRFVWQDLVTDDVDACRRFYSALLGWEFEEITRLGEPYTLVRNNGSFVAGIAAAQRKKQNESISQWLSYLLVTDVEGAVRANRDAGGGVLVSPVQLTENIRAAVIADPEGAPLGLVSYGGNVAGPPHEVATGAFFWRDYLASDVEAAGAFYRSFQGYDAEPLSMGGVSHLILRRSGDAGRPVGGVVPIGAASVRPHWLPYIRVEDPAALAKKAAALGGRVLLEPNASDRGGSLAIVADPSGAAVALQKWPI